MFASGPNYNKLKTNLRLSINRLKLLEKKKTEQAQKARKEIADFISGHKEDRARIRVEHIIREDYIVEAYELIEMYCDLLLARFGLIQQMKEIDEGIEEAVNSVLWVAPRIVSDCQEFKIIAEQFTVKYGKPYVDACRANQFNKVNPKLMMKLSVAAPPKLLVEKYMIEIAKSHNVPFSPDENVMREDEVASAERMLIDFQNQGHNQPGGFQWMYPNPQMGPGMPNQPQPPASTFPDPPPIYKPGRPDDDDDDFDGGVGAAQSLPPPPAAFNYPSVKQNSGMPPSNIANYPSPDVVSKLPITDGVPSAPPQSMAGNEMPSLPDVPNFDHQPSDDDGDDLDLDNLNKRFENLKKKS